MSTFLHGVGTVQYLDKSAEIVDLKGLDISSLAKSGVINYEHQNNFPAQLVGKILKAKKIFSKDDCSNDDERYFWNKVKVPYLYIMAELLDDYCDSAKHVAGVLRYDRDRKGQNEYAIMWFSVEGSEIPGSRTNKQIVARGIARKVTLTSAPCNQGCAAEIKEESRPSQIAEDFDSIFKSQEEAITLFKSGEGEKIYTDYLAKRDAVGPSIGGKPPKNPYSEYENQGTRIGTTQSGKHVFSHGHIGDYGFNPAEHQEAAEHHRRAAVTAENPKLADNHIQRMAQHNNAAISGGRQENRAALSLNQKRKVSQEQGKQQVAKSEKLCDLHKAKVDEGKSPEDKAWDRSARNHRHSVATTTWKEPKGIVNKILGTKPKEKTHVHERFRAAAGHKDVRFGSQADPGYGPKTSAMDNGGTVTSSRKVVGTPAKSMKKSEGWSSGKVKGDSVHYSHPEHGVVSIQKQPSGEFHVKHNGAFAGVGGVKGSFSGAKEAGTHAKKYMQAVNQGKTLSNAPQNHPSPSMVGKDIKKAVDAGSYNAAPSTLVNGAAYQTENVMSKQVNTGAENHSFQATKKKDWKKRAKDDYENWPHREKFEQFMKARMPHLADGEIRAIGRAISLKKSMEMEKSLEGLVGLEKKDYPHPSGHITYTIDKKGKGNYQSKFNESGKPGEDKWMNDHSTLKEAKDHIKQVQLRPCSCDKCQNDFSKSEQPLKKSQKIDLVHYSSHPNLTEIDPKFHGKGVDSRTKGRDTWHPHSFYYKAGSEPEAVVTQRSPHKYHTSIDTHKQPIYDIGEDREGHVSNSSHMDEVHEKLKSKGYHGFHNSKHDTLPHVVAMYHPLKVEKEKNVAKSESNKPILKNYNDFRSAIKQADASIPRCDKHKEFQKSENKPTAPKTPNSKVRAVADSYAASKGLKLNHETPFHQINPEHSAKIANAYSEMKHDPSHPAVKSAYGALANETKDQYKHLMNNGLKISRIEPGMENPYKNGSKDLTHDITNNNHMWYYPTQSGFGSGEGNKDHPLLAPSGETHGGQPLLHNDLFRIVHDYFGHAKEGHTFGPRGEDNAWKNHMQMYSPEAQKALTSETRGQNSWVNYGPHGENNRKNPAQTVYAEQKAGLLPDWVSEHPDLPSKK